jgi:hypothetical protein
LEGKYPLDVMVPSDVPAMPADPEDPAHPGCPTAQAVVVTPPRPQVVPATVAS